ncbi:MAG: hypothetical protein QOJ65_180, partial [Fimbriimonadaceae bacterium]|nr:hypothetical protein [Fimbriimonadaceae bacterium]
MITIFVVCALVGGILILLSLLGADHSADVHADAHFELGHDTDHDAIGSFLNHLPFLSVRFWAYGLAAFGLAGIMLTTVAKAPPGTVLPTAIVFGLICGTLVVWALRALSKGMVSTGASLGDLMGAEGTVTVAVRGEVPGRIRCNLKGEIIDLLAIPEPGQTLEIGTSVIVTTFENDRARV